MDDETVNKCGKCGTDVAANGAFCPKCGAPVGAVSCKRCGTTIENDARFCGKCGASVDVVSADAAAEQARRVIGQVSAVASQLAKGGMNNMPKRTRLLFGGIVAVVILYAVCRPHTNVYVFEQHPMYEPNMTTMANVAQSRDGVTYQWPYQGHEDRLKMDVHPTSYGQGTPDQISHPAPTKQQISGAMRQRPAARDN